MTTNDTITLTMTMQTPAGMGAAYMANLQAAFAHRYPELVSVIDHYDANNNPVYASDPNGVIERATVQYWFLDVFTQDAATQGAAAAKAAAIAALSQITTSVTIDNTPAQT